MTTSNPDSAAAEKNTGLTRRQVITTAAAGGAALVVTGLGGAAVGSAATTAQYEVELIKLRALVALYEQLERVGLDAILAAGMNIVRGALEAVKGGVALLGDGIAAVETALKNFQTTLDALGTAANAAGQALGDLAEKFHAAEGVVVAVLGTATPLAESISGFFNALLAKIPFGIGDDIRRAAQALVDLVRAIPAAIDVMTNQLLAPLRDNFFPTRGDPAVKASLIDPIVKSVLEPLKKTQSDVAALVDHWEKDLATPAQAALTERQTIRDQITEYKKQNGIA